MKEQQVPIGPRFPLGTIPEVEEEAGDVFTEKSWEPSNFDLSFGYDQFGQTPLAGVTTPSSEVISLRDTAIVDPPGVQNFANLDPAASDGDAPSGALFGSRDLFFLSSLGVDL